MDRSDPDYDKADAEVYQIVVDMAEQLVPDVCALIMGFLEEIHISLGKEIWLEKIKDVNVEYKNEQIGDPRAGYSCKSLFVWPGFSFNCRLIGDPNALYTQIFNKKFKKPQALLPFKYR